MTGIIVGFFMVVISSLIGEVRVGMEKAENESLRETIKQLRKED